MLHVVIVIMVIFGVSLVGALWIGAMCYILLWAFLNCASGELLYARLGIRMLKKNGVLLPGLLPAGTKLPETLAPADNVLPVHDPDPNSVPLGLEKTVE